MRLARAVIAASALLALAACGALPERGHATDGDTASVALADATALDDPRSYTGPTHAGLGELAIEPVAQDVEPALPVTVTDSQGTKVTVTDASRILALDVYGTLSQTVFELGLGDRVVGRDVSTQFAEAEDLPLVTSSGHDLSAEKILELNPSVILTDTSLGPWDVVLQMRDAGIPVVVVDGERGLDNIDDLTHQVAEALGVPEQGDALADRTQAEVEQVRAEIAKVAPATTQGKLRAAFLYVRGNAGIYYMFGEGSGADGLIDALGLYDVAGEIGWKGMKPVNDEGIVAAQPELLILMTKGLESAGGVDGLLERLPALAQTPAGQNRRIVDMDDAFVLGYGPRTADVLNSLAVAVYAPESVEAAE
ncbi:ABC transporter substrate-binding protein [Aeromicrobium sp. IC_218]|uniref:heme/hemin ABC transporter substrate-binding protein n=1 Tax=Aeromicrobium sp. IC_218 TaxID=2545468 RepID=UPI001038E3FB|nr:ABC transporter substrate-binding protein [Aeromicrobium sp. IC_218]TCI95921.1 hemin receptor [Aeromicrobium sp. IC_218]